MDENKKICPTCGGEVTEETTVCPFCGQQLKPEEGAPAVPPILPEEPGKKQEIPEGTGDIPEDFPAETVPEEAVPEEVVPEEVISDEAVPGEEVKPMIISSSIPPYVPKAVDRRPAPDTLPDVEPDVNTVVKNQEPGTKSKANVWLWIAIGIIVLLALCMACCLFFVFLIVAGSR